VLYVPLRRLFWRSCCLWSASIFRSPSTLLGWDRTSTTVPFSLRIIIFVRRSCSSSSWSRSACFLSQRALEIPSILRSNSQGQSLLEAILLIFLLDQRDTAPSIMRMVLLLFLRACVLHFPALTSSKNDMGCYAACGFLQLCSSDLRFSLLLKKLSWSLCTGRSCLGEGATKLTRSGQPRDRLDVCPRLPLPQGKDFVRQRQAPLDCKT
jgi:hypothetical protein